MGISIAEMLGYDLSDEQPDEVSAESASEDADADEVEAAVVAALLDESTVKAEDFRSDMSLAEDFDLDEIGLYAVVAAVEQDLKISLKDADVAQVKTLEDLIGLARKTRG
ncbi:acyl carrier protein [uncultured Actinomyces sp.]|uniref:acyl carrier protein n=1 Tax=uncultured Actinomyces sp. TaxID=249061 RepID=UPI00261942C4|nr:phosphopantetheine-binding protein [uncultured Actinomyces sp.]